MRKSFSALVLLVWASLSNQAWAQELWQGAAHGMTIEQVRAVLPRAIPPKSSPDIIPPDLTERLRIPDYEIVGIRFEAKFFFKSDLLAQVMLKAPDDIPLAKAQRAFDALNEALRAKYGQGTPSSSSSIFLQTRAVTWQAGRTNVSLNLIVVGDAPPVVLNVNYQARVAAEADKL